MGNAPARTGRRTRPVFSVFPETAATGDTFAACFAGTLAASSTVTSPMPPPSLWTSMLPWWASTMDLASGRPNPMPWVPLENRLR